MHTRMPVGLGQNRPKGACHETRTHPHPDHRVLIVFGSAKLPDIAKSIGQSMKVFKKEVQELKEDVPADSEESKD